MVALLLVAVSVGLSNFAAAIGIGAGGVDNRTRLRVGLVFGLYEAGMPIAGLVLGQRFASTLGRTTHWVGGALLIALGLYGLIKSIRSAGDGDAPQAGSASRSRLLVSGFALSIDNLVIGFALGTYQVNVLTGTLVIGLVSVALSLAGLELGARMGRWSGRRSEQLGGLLLISVGVAIAAGTLS
ncbi:MAG: manganese efflux pump [Streptosporangiaceae bacterium]|jgi:putative Mn2+ efflux pump MntP